MNHLHRMYGMSDSREYVTTPFSTVEELLQIGDLPAVAREPGFSHFAISDYHNTIIGVYDEGFKWWVYGYVDEPVDLPQWKARWMTVERGEISNEEFSSACGRTITLKDGTQLTNANYDL